MNWLYHIFGINGTGPWYAFWSGTGSDIGEVTIIGGLLAMYKKHTCHEPRCWRLGHHPVEGTPYVACRKHHPALPGKARRGDIAEAYRRHKAAQTRTLRDPKGTRA